MRLICLSDTHGLHELYTEQLAASNADVLIHAGDFTPLTTEALTGFLEWLDALPIPNKIVVAGNHELQLERYGKAYNKSLFVRNGATYLHDEGITLEGKLFYGSPWQPEFNNWAFNLPRDGKELANYWAGIPRKTDVLITHSPPALPPLDRSFKGESLGCELLAKQVERVKPKYHIFGHIHSGYGMLEKNGTTYINCSALNDQYGLLVSHVPIIVEV